MNQPLDPSNTVVITSDDVLQLPSTPRQKNTRRKRQYNYIPVESYSGRLGSPLKRNDRCKCGQKRKRCCCPKPAA
jgi:hypothetical protein